LLGRQTYEFYNAVGRTMDKTLAAMGAERVFPLGEGDDDANLEEDFAAWEDSFWPEVCDKYGLSSVLANMGPQRDYALAPVPAAGGPALFTGEMAVIGALAQQKRPHHAKNPFLARVVHKAELFRGTDRSCLHLELDLANSGLRYAAGDHVAVYPTNSRPLAEQLARRLRVDLDAAVALTAVDPYAKKKTPFPSPCTFRTALLHYVDIAAPVHTHVLRELAHYTQDAPTAARLQHLASRAGAKDYHQYIVHDCRTLLEVLTDMPSVHPDVGHVLELLPRLQVW
jgi:NADPH-ferrihemoprotein reductase